MPGQTEKKIFAGGAAGGAVGAFIGSLTALGFNAAFWWIGALIGGLIGYLSYDWKRVVRAIPIAARTAGPIFVATLIVIGNNIRSSFCEWFGRPRPLFYLLLLANTMIFACWVKPSSPKEGFLRPIGICFSFFLIQMGLLFIFSIIMIFPLLCSRTTTEKWRKKMNVKYIEPWNTWDMTSIDDVILFYLDSFLCFMRGLLYTVRFCVITVPCSLGRFLFAAARFLPRFGWKMFLLIHSEERMICGVDAMIGASIGSRAGPAIVRLLAGETVGIPGIAIIVCSMLVGALAGGFLGVANYKIITERWLRPRGFLPPLPAA